MLRQKDPAGRASEDGRAQGSRAQAPGYRGAPGQSWVIPEGVGGGSVVSGDPLKRGYRKVQ